MLMPAARAKSSLVFGVMNSQNLPRTAQRWGPLLSLISQTTGHEMRLRMGPTAEDTNAMMARGDFDFAFTNQHFSHQPDGTYRVIAGLAGPAVQGVLAVASDSPLRQLADLRNRRVAFTSREAFETYAVPMLALRKAGVNVLPTFSATQDAAIVALLAGQVDAAAASSRMLGRLAAQRGLNHRLVFSSEPFPDVPVVVHPRVPKATVAAVCQALLDLTTTTQGLDVLQAADLPGFVHSSDARYAPVRKVYRALT